MSLAHFFGGDSYVNGLEKENKEMRSRVGDTDKLKKKHSEQIKSIENSFKEEIDRIRDGHNHDMRYKNREIECLQYDLQNYRDDWEMEMDKIHTRTREDAEYKIATAKNTLVSKHNEELNAIRNDSSVVMREVQDDFASELAVIKLKHADEIAAYKSEAGEAEATAEAFSARFDEQTKVVQTLMELLNETRDFQGGVMSDTLNLVSDKLPNVDLTKFNVNVEVPTNGNNVEVNNK